MEFRGARMGMMPCPGGRVVGFDVFDVAGFCAMLESRFNREWTDHISPLPVRSPSKLQLFVLGDLDAPAFPQIRFSLCAEASYIYGNIPHRRPETAKAGSHSLILTANPPRSLPWQWWTRNPIVQRAIDLAELNAGHKIERWGKRLRRRITVMARPESIERGEMA